MIGILTCPKLNENIQGIDEVTNIIQAEPQDEEAALELQEHGAGDDEDDVVEDCHGDDEQPAVVERIRWVHKEVCPVPFVFF
ncbi:hypothetical protein ElyMa_006090600 [Elysia marginata]|uniref:Uncharacterized protein n=1 Tax=Elysia marginata TaxID=1093978 RepID=A0AAV4GRI3_9GAST|nr:hypothetical protein ElyMa_006090600 [Elysia marginata]